MDYSGFNIAVIGDFMLDVWNEAEEIKKLSEGDAVDFVNPMVKRCSPGGAGNLACCLVKLGAGCSVFGTVGQFDSRSTFLDESSQRLRMELRSRKVNCNGLQVEPLFSLHQKKRFMDGNKLLFRISSEHYIVGMSAMGAYESLEDRCGEFSAIACSDYNKGVLQKPIIENITALCKVNNIPLMVDPKFDNFWEYKGATIFKPNLAEFKKDRDRNKGGQFDSNIENMVITMGEHGMQVRHNYGGLTSSIPAHKVEIADVTGAGDTVMAVLTLEYLRTKDIIQAAKLANVAGALAVQVHGTAQITAEELGEAAEKWL